MHASRLTQSLSVNSFIKFVCFSPRALLLCWNMLLLKCEWMWILSVWTCAWNSSRQRLSGEKASFNENECNMWIQVSHWSIGASQPIQHLNLPPRLLTRPHQCHPPPVLPTFFSFSAPRLPLTLWIHPLIHPFSGAHKKLFCCEWAAELRTAAQLPGESWSTKSMKAIKHDFSGFYY